MKDTSAEMEVTYRELLMRRSGEERVRMAGRMFDSARTLALAGIEAQGGAATAAEARANLFLRFYGRDFDDETRNRIAEKLRTGGTGGK